MFVVMFTAPYKTIKLTFELITKLLQCLAYNRSSWINLVSLLLMLVFVSGGNWSFWKILVSFYLLNSVYVFCKVFTCTCTGICLKPYTCTLYYKSYFLAVSFTINIQFIDKVWMFICNNWQLAVQIIMIICCYWFARVGN